MLVVIACFLPVFSKGENPIPKQAVRTYLPDPLVVTAFTPPAPVEPKRLPNIRIDATTKLTTSSGKTLTLQRGEASELPDLPPPPPPEPIQPPRELTAEQRARLIYQQRHTLNLGATVFDHKVSQVQWTDQETGISYQALCGFDLGLLAGIGKFVSDGADYSVFLIHSDIDSTPLKRSKIASPIPSILPGQILITKGNPNDSAANRVPQLLRDLISTEKERLLTYQSARLRHQQDAAAWAKANPPVPRDEIIVLRPHRGSRYLANPQPEKKEAAR